MKKFVEFMEAIEKKRRLYVGDDNLMALKHLIDGYVQCLRNYGIRSEKDLAHDYAMFEGFVCKSLGVKKSEKSFWTIIIERSQSDDEAYTIFFELFHKYLREIPNAIRENTSSGYDV